MSSGRAAGLAARPLGSRDERGRHVHSVARSDLHDLDGRHVFDGVHTQGCIDCMVNPVWLHNFSDTSVSNIYLEMGLLAASSCLFHSLSNFATTAEAWRGPRCSIHHRVKRTGLGQGCLTCHASTLTRTRTLTLATPSPILSATRSPSL